MLFWVGRVVRGVESQSEYRSVVVGVEEVKLRRPWADISEEVFVFRGQLWYWSYVRGWNSKG